MSFYNWTVYAIKDSHANYNENNPASFDFTWINSIIDSYNMKKPDATPKSTAFSVIIPTFDGTNWHDVKAKVIALLPTRVGTSGIPPPYLIRETLPNVGGYITTAQSPGEKDCDNGS